MKFRFKYVGFLLATHCVVAQGTRIIGEIRDQGSGEPLTQALVQLEGDASATASREGRFELLSRLKGDLILRIEARDYRVRRLPVTLGDALLDLGMLYLEREEAGAKSDPYITLASDELSGEVEIIGSAELLQATRDVFLNRAAFDFGQAFFKVRGYDSKYGTVLLNGVPMNKLTDGRPQWNNWGGLNDVTRNQEFSYGLEASSRCFGGILGSTYIDTSPSAQRPGIRVSGSLSNRSYAGRIMATLNSGIGDSGLSYALSASRRWAKEGYREGSLYDAYAVYGALEYRFDPKSVLMLTGIFSTTRRGLSAAITEEVHEMGGHRYNPYWGLQGREIRNSRERHIAEPILMLNHAYASGRLRLNTVLAYQFGSQGKSRLGYFNAPNPDPSYYRYLPSYYINSPIGANFIGASLAREGFFRNPQLKWEKLYQANTIGNSDGKAAYVLYADTNEDKVLSFHQMANFETMNGLAITVGAGFQKTVSHNFARIRDLLGAQFHEDVDPFTGTRNDQEGELRKQDGDIFNYNYRLQGQVWDIYAQLSVHRDKWNAFLSGNYKSTTYFREGLFLNERFPEHSAGKEMGIPLRSPGGKAGFTYKISGRHWISLNGAFVHRAPVLQDVFINPREQNGIVPGIQNEHITTADLNYNVRLPHLIGRISGYYTRFQHATDVNFFYVESGLGADFVQESTTGLDQLHMGLEAGLEYEASATVKVSVVAAVGKQLYASDPEVTLNFVPGNDPDTGLQSAAGSLPIGIAGMKGYRLAQGPQQAYSIGISYRDPNYWWAGITANFLTENYASIATVPRTQSFILNPETGNPFPEATPEIVARILKQNPLDDSYFLNFVGGKSWLNKKTYISLFASINNVFDAVYRTGGYEQSRNGNYGQWIADNQGGTPSFGAKYWYGAGRTFFLNLAISF